MLGLCKVVDSIVHEMQIDTERQCLTDKVYRKAEEPRSLADLPDAVCGGFINDILSL